MKYISETLVFLNYKITIIHFLTQSSSRMLFLNRITYIFTVALT